MDITLGLPSPRNILYVKRGQSCPLSREDSSSSASALYIYAHSTCPDSFDQIGSDSAQGPPAPLTTPELRFSKAELPAGRFVYSPGGIQQAPMAFLKSASPSRADAVISAHAHH
jgi:hypothetical protein